MSSREAVRRLLAAVLPWPHRKDRKAAVEAARRQAAESRRRAARARTIAAELTQMAADNHFADAIARQIREGRRP